MHPPGERRVGRRPAAHPRDPRSRVSRGPRAGADRAARDGRGRGRRRVHRPTRATPGRRPRDRRRRPGATRAGGSMASSTRTAMGSNASYSRPSTCRPSWRRASASCPGAGVPGVARVRPMKRDDAPVLVRREPLGQRLHEVRGKRGVVDLEDAQPAVVRPAAHRRDDAIRRRRRGRVRVRVGAVTGEPERGRPGRGWDVATTAAQASSIGRPDGRSSRSSRMPADSRWIANSRRRRQDGSSGPAHHTSSPPPKYSPAARMVPAAIVPT